MAEAPGVRLHAHGSQLIAGENVYFAFGSGRLTYDCQSCGAVCCRGHGYFLEDGPPLHEQLRRRLLPLFATVAGAPSRGVIVHNAAPGCFFLDGQGRCQIHVESGYERKPETCRLFPFNQLYRLGTYLVVLPHESLCPLQIVESSEGSAKSNHGVLLEAMASQGVYHHIPEVTTTGDFAERIAIERRIVALAEDYRDHRDYLEFAEHQRRCDHGSDGAATMPLRVIAAHMCDVLGLPQRLLSEPHPEIVRAMIAVTPYLRARWLCSRLDTTSRYGAPEVPTRTAEAMACTYVLCEAARYSGMSDLSFQTVSKIAADFAPLIRVLSDVQAVMVWCKHASIAVPTSLEANALRLRFWQLAKDLLPGTQKVVGRSLGEVLRKHMPDDALTRALFVRAVVPELVGRLRGIDDRELPHAAPSLRQRARNTIQRWLIAAADPVLVHAAHDRLLGFKAAAAGFEVSATSS